MRKLAALAWALGLSLDRVVSVFQDLGVDLSRTTLWRDGQALAPYLRMNGRSRAVNFLNAGSSLFGKMIYREEIILVLQIEQTEITLGIIDEDGPHSARTWLESLAEEIGLEVTVKVSPRAYLN